MSEILTTALVNALAQAAIEATTASFVAKLPLGRVKNKIDELGLILNKGLPRYLEANYAKCETLKTLLNRDPRPLDECFVVPDFVVNEQLLPSDQFLRHTCGDGSKTVVTGLAGSGKSVFLKYSFRKLIENGVTYYPVFFELRALNRIAPAPGMLLSEIYASIKECCSEFSRPLFDFGLNNGFLYLLLDGFDEISHELRLQVSEEILQISRSHYKCAIMITSRPSDEFGSWEGFSEARLQPFDLPKVIEYIGKVKFDEEKKKDFCDDLKSGVFEANKSFLSNPLLAAMMLLTYDSFGEIPEKRHIFYSKCFDVLAREHDNFKGRYKRELYSKLTMEQLEYVFVFFCAYSYSERQFEFDQNEISKYVTEALEAAGCSADVNDLIRDFTESISIMEKVGLIYEFAHRSFQEYFYAKFVVSDRRLPLRDKINWLIGRFRYDDTIDMIADMDRTYFEDDYLLPEAKKLAKKISDIDPHLNPGKIIGQFYSDMRLAPYGDREDDEKKHIVWSYANSPNVFLLRQAWKYRPSYGDALQSHPLAIEIPEDVAMKKLIQYRGRISMHYSSNPKLIELGGGAIAEKMQKSISCLVGYLQDKQNTRQRSLGQLIKRQYIRSVSARRTAR
jgi:hypothetical protein